MTRTDWRSWAEAPTAVIVTALDVLEEKARAEKEATRGRT